MASARSLKSRMNAEDEHSLPVELYSNEGVDQSLAIYKNVLDDLEKICKTVMGLDNSERVVSLLKAIEAVKVNVDGSIERIEIDREIEKSTIRYNEGVVDNGTN